MLDSRGLGGRDVNMTTLLARGDKLENGHYTVLAELGVGGMGVVYHCRDELLLREVAIKMLLPELMADKNSVEVFRQEARLAAQLEHPNIVTIYDVGVEERLGKQNHFVAMEYLPGGNLAAKVTTGPLPVEHCLNWMKQLAAGLSFAHKRGVIHQDIKADNIFITNEGDLKIGDFGLARLLVGRVHCNASIKGMGTPAYMSPELCRGDPQDHRSDIYSLGVLFFEMATGQLPFRARGMIEMAMKHSTAPVPSVRRINPIVPDILDRVIRRMMAKTPEERYQSALEVQNIIDDLIFDLRLARLGIGNRPVLRSKAIELPDMPAAPDSVRSAGTASGVTDAAGGATARGVQAGAGQERASFFKSSTSGQIPPVGRQRDSDGSDAIPLGSGSSTDKTSSDTSLGSEKSAAKSGGNEKTGAERAAASGKSPSGTRSGADSRPAAAGALDVETDQNATLPPERSSGYVERTPKQSATKIPVAKPAKLSLELKWTHKTGGPIGWLSQPVIDKSEATILVGSFDGYLYAIESASGREIWKYRADGPIVSSPASMDGKVLVADARSSLSALSLSDGSLLWKGDCGASMVAPPAVYKNAIVTSTRDGKVLALDSASGKRLWTFTGNGTIVSGVQQHGGIGFVGTRNGACHAFSLDNGKELWRFTAEGPIISSAAIAADSVYFGSQAGTVYALEAETGNLIWEYPCGQPILSRCVIVFTSVIFSSLDRWLYCCEKYDGTLKWKAPLRGKVLADLVVSRGAVVAISQEGCIQCFSAASGELKWQMETSRNVESPPLVHSRMLYVGTIDGEVMAYALPFADSAT